MAKFREYFEAELTEAEQNQIKQERDVFETKLDMNEQAFLDSILNDNQFKADNQNPLNV